MKLTGLKNIKIVVDEDLYKLFCKCETVIGVSSTAIYEAMIFGCKPIFVDLPSIEYYHGIINKFNLPVLTRKSNIVEALRKSKNSKIEIDYLLY